ncbi:MAG TPA: condensation domain-containing protein, partial [Pyrinomonadaceae bacterium]|nr:condensation domain-containing protein [Pyrinomonadaceae bacterium]
ALYSSYQKGTEPSLPPLPIHYQDFVAWQSRRLASEALAEDRNYWLNQLSGKLPALELVTDYSRPKVRTFNGEVVQFTIDKSLTGVLYLFSRDYDATLFMTLLSGLYALFYRYTGQSDIILGTPISGRTHKDLEGQIGLYLNLLPLGVAVHGEDSFAELLDQVRDVTLSGYEHQAYPFASLIKELNFERDPARPPLISAGLTLQNLNPLTSATGDELGFKVSQFSQEIKTSEYDLWFLFSERFGELTANVNYNTDIFQRETIELIWSRLVSVFVQVTDEPARKIMDLEMSDGGAVIPEQIHELAIELNV